MGWKPKSSYTTHSLDTAFSSERSRIHVPLVSANPVDEETGIRLGDYAVEFLRTHLNVG